MIITKTPYRVSFFGGGTDYPEWYLAEGGAVLSTTIDKYCYITCRVFPPFFANKHRIVWSHIETVSTVAEILHPVVREGMRFLGYDDSMGLEVHHQGDLPARSGIGSSSSFTVGFINALEALRGQRLGKHELAMKAIELEQQLLKENVGSQDQVAAAYGGVNLIEFKKSGEIQVHEPRVPRERLEELQSRLLLVFTGHSRLGSDIATDLVGTLRSKHRILSGLRTMVDQATDILEGNGCLDDLGRLLDAGWALKRQLSGSVTTPAIDTFYRTAIDHGALGGKLLGAGGTGFMVFYVPPHKRQSVIKALASCLYVPFKFEFEGTQFIQDDAALNHLPVPAGHVP